VIICRRDASKAIQAIQPPARVLPYRQQPTFGLFLRQLQDDAQGRFAIVSRKEPKLLGRVVYCSQNHSASFANFWITSRNPCGSFLRASTRSVESCRPLSAVNGVSAVTPKSLSISFASAAVTVLNFICSTPLMLLYRPIGPSMSSAN